MSSTPDVWVNSKVSWPETDDDVRPGTDTSIGLGQKTWDQAFNRPVTNKLLFEIEYADRDGVITERTIEPKSIHLLTGRPEFYIRAVCHLLHEVRTFYTPRIRKCTNLQTNRPLKDLGD